MSYALPPAPGIDEVCVVIPTFNESANIGRLIERLRELGPLRVIVVDDGSPDGTGAVVDALARRDERLEVIHRQSKSGRGSACLEGLRRALSRPQTRCVVEMDADFSHDPSELSSMVAALADTDVVVRSRYLPGSSVLGWSLSRRIFSKASNRLARLLLNIPLSDLTNGYRAYSRPAAECVAARDLCLSGYIALSESADRLYAQGFRFAELPTVFVNRVRGQSNLSLYEIYQALSGILRLGAARAARTIWPWAKTKATPRIGSRGTRPLP
ncbi:MAG: hypothetical protein A2X40_07970 [Elusimicrobia bacterium GWC2_65_9]|nr:MAG: hypothetical protein A2X37_12370 [Elusimicrobia bacterium GWA2_66_18]OGR73661.1 MAG: hypothetical protein A2X40_07970 [Elusimicrobia bacterium GWC2_65_9]